jgi:hypothetical protein
MLEQEQRRHAVSTYVSRCLGDKRPQLKGSIPLSFAEEDPPSATFVCCCTVTATKVMRDTLQQLSKNLAILKVIDITL